MLQILTEKGEQRLEEERRKRDREECERVDEELKGSKGPGSRTGKGTDECMGSKVGKGTDECM